MVHVENIGSACGNFRALAHAQSNHQHAADYRLFTLVSLSQPLCASLQEIS